MKKNLMGNYSPLFFLSALGAGGMAITFFIYLVYMTPHKGTPIPTFESLQILLLQQNAVSILVGAAMTMIALLSLYHVRLLVWNVSEYRKFKQTEAFIKMKSTNAEVTLMTIPLTFAMSVSVLFAAGAIFVPGLWNYVEYLFPVAIGALLVIAFFAIKIFTEYFTRLIVNGDFDFVQNNNLSQMLGIFAFAMVAVGFSAPAAMSHNHLTSTVAAFLAIMFVSITILLALIKMLLGFKSILKHGIAEATAPTLWIIIPILTLLGITLFRLTHGLDHTFNTVTSQASYFVLTSVIVSLQLLFGFIGYKVMKHLNFFEDYIHGEKKSPTSYALICPGVASVVFGVFFLVIGLTRSGIVEEFSPAYFILLAPLVYIQFKTLFTMLKLNKRLLYEEKQPLAAAGA